MTWGCVRFVSSNLYPDAFEDFGEDDVDASSALSDLAKRKRKAEWKRRQSVRRISHDPTRTLKV